MRELIGSEPTRIYKGQLFGVQIVVSACGAGLGVGVPSQVRKIETLALVQDGMHTPRQIFQAEGLIND